VVCLFGCGFLVLIGIQPPNEMALWIVLGSCGVTAAVWFGVMRHRFQGPPQTLLSVHRRSAGNPIESGTAPTGPTD
jgi:hypothetical protein